MGSPPAAEDRERLRYLRTFYKGKAITTSPRLWLGIGAAFLVFLAAEVVFGEGGVLRGNRLEKDLGRIREQNTRLRDELARMRAEHAVRTDDPLSIERAGRERFGLARPDELIFWFDDDGIVPPVPGDPESAATPR